MIRVAPLKFRQALLAAASIAVAAVAGCQSNQPPLQAPPGGASRNGQETRPSSPVADSDAYEHYVDTSRDFHRVKQDKAWTYKAWPQWIYMPWCYQWTIGFNHDSGEWSLAYGYNGTVINSGNVSSLDPRTDEESPMGHLDWLNEFHLRFYMDHTAGKGNLHQWDSLKLAGVHRQEIEGTGIRTKPVNAALAEEIHQIIQKRVKAVQNSPWRAAYALDDEISWGHFAHPSMWCVTDDKEAFPRWLHEIYGENPPPHPQWIGYNDIRGHLQEWDVAHFDASALMDQWSFNDSYWLNFIGDLVEYTNQLDPHTPVGFVGAQSPNAFGGWDYAKVMRKVQYLEPYDIGSAQALRGSFEPPGALPLVTTHFHNKSDTDGVSDIWHMWYYLAQGNRGVIGWVENWFNGKTPEPWLDKVAPNYLEIENKISPVVMQADWLSDGVGIYYNHASLQLAWIMDAEPHGASWVNRNGDHRVGSAHLGRKAWENMLRDSGLQYNFISYVDVIQHGVPSQCKALILPDIMCLSDAEAKQIRKFCKNGGTVIADFMPGLWDQHGKGRADGGVLDDVFGVKQDPHMTEADVFGGKLWVETNQETNFGYKTYQELLTNDNNSIKDTSGFDKAERNLPVMNVHKYGKGTAVLLNLSPQWYNAYRMAGFQQAQRRQTFIKPLNDAGVKRWVEIKNGGEREFGYEITYFTKNGRTILFLCTNPEVQQSESGDTSGIKLSDDTIPVTLSFAGKIRGVRDERAGKNLPDGSEFHVNWKMNEAVVLSFAGAPPKP